MEQIGNSKPHCYNIVLRCVHRLVFGNFGKSEIHASYGQNLRELARTYGKNLHSVTSRDSELTSYEYGAKGNDRPGL